MSAQIGTQTYEPPANGFRTFFVMWLTQAFFAFFAVTVRLSTSLYARQDQKPDLAFAGGKRYPLRPAR